MAIVKKNYYRPIDYSKLKAALTAKGTCVTDASIDIGRSKNYISGLKATGQIRVNDALLIEKILGIPYSEYEYHDPEPAPKPVEPPKEECKHEHEASESDDHIDYNRLYKTIYMAAYRALTRALAGEDINGRTA